MSQIPLVPAHGSLMSSVAKKMVYLTIFMLLSFMSCRKQDYFIDKYATVVGSMYATLPHGLISLTYDDGPGPGTLELAKYLYSEHICATFFVVGNSEPGGGYMNYPLLDSLIYYGQRIGNHTFNHVDLRNLSCADAQQQIQLNQDNIDAVIQNNLCYFTPPWFGWTTSISSCILMDRQLNHLRGPIGMTYDTQDYLYRQATHPEICAQHFLNDPVNLNKFNSGDGGIVKMHDFNSYLVRDFALQETKIIVRFLKSKGYSFVAPTLEFSPAKINFGAPGDFSEEPAWSPNTSYLRTIRLADVNGDGKADLIGRKAEGVYVAISNGLKFSQKQIWTKEFSDNKGWRSDEYSSTLRFSDVNGDGKADLIVRGKDGIHVSLSSGNSFSASALWTNDFSDGSKDHWNKEEGYYGTIRTADVNGDGLADIVGRGMAGIYVGLSTGNSFQPAELWTSEFSDSATAEWKKPKYSSTIQLADVDGDGRADLVLRSAKGILVSQSNGRSFEYSVLWTTAFSDKTGCGQDASYYGSIRVADINGDNRADLLARAKDGIHVLLSSGQSFLDDMIWYSEDFTDKTGYKPACYSNTFQCGDINGDKRSDFIFRSIHGISGSFSP